MRTEEEAVLLKGGRLVDPGFDGEESVDLLIRNGRIEAIGKDLSFADVRVKDIRGQWIVPGLIDLHVHFREPGEEEKETIATGSAAAVKGGFTAVCCMPNTSPPLDTPAGIRFVIDRANVVGKARVYPIGAITMGLEGEGLTNIGSLAEAGAVALSDDGRMVMDSRIMRRAMEYAKAFGIPFTLHSIDENLAAGGHMNEGVVSAKLGVSGSPAHAEIIAVMRDVALAELTGARVHIAHVSTKGAIEVIRRAKEKGLPVTAEVTPHHLILTEEAVEDYDPNFKMNPPLRTKEDREALQEALQEGIIDAIATDHAPHTVLEKSLPFDEAPFGVTGLETAVAATYTYLVKPGILKPRRWIESLATMPAKIFGLPGGRLAVGEPADLTVIDPNLAKEVKEEDFVGKGKNSCFLGETLSGWPTMTFVGGRCQYAAEE
ncbi:MAG: dihydroorotase [Candidatus Hydrogenedentota bacterium]|nr:MAG: dihydroorotase [Candidatus Hydrogenedentota bacterium]